MQRSQLDQRNAGYLSNLKTKERESGYRCLCCRDTALIPGDVIARYSVVKPHEYHCDYDLLEPDSVTERAGKFYGALGYLCRRLGCRANTVEVTALDEGRPYSKPVPRFSDAAVSKEISPEICEWIHQQEVVRLKGLADISPQKAITAINQAVKEISRPMPIDPVANPAPEKPITEYDGYTVGDHVRITVSRFSQSEQKEIIRNREVPVGEVGLIIGFEISRISGDTVAVVDFQDVQRRLSSIWFEPVQNQEVAA